MTNSVDLDQMRRIAAFDMDLHYLRGPVSPNTEENKHFFLSAVRFLDLKLK